MQHILISLIQIYRKYLSPLFPPACRFYPTCSEYALQAIQRYGAIKGSGYALWRILHCHPWCQGGYDPLK